MQTFNITLNETNYKVNVIEVGDEYGENKDVYEYYEVPLLEFKSEGNELVTHVLCKVLDANVEIKVNENTLSLDDKLKVYEELSKIWPEYWLDSFTSLTKKSHP